MSFVEHKKSTVFCGDQSEASENLGFLTYQNGEVCTGAQCINLSGKLQKLQARLRNSNLQDSNYLDLSLLAPLPL